MTSTAKILERARAAKFALGNLDTDSKNLALHAMADSLIENAAKILEANQRDLDKAKGVISETMLDRLSLNLSRIRAMAEGIYEVANLPDPVGEVLEKTTRRDMKIKKVAVPLGVVAIIYESRPNVTADAAALALKSGNVCVLRGGKEAFLSNMAITDALRSGLMKCGLNPDFVSLVEDISRDSANEIMTATGYVDLLIPRGGAGLINACVQNAKVPCIQTGTGICHIYVDRAADLGMAANIVKNAKTSRPSVCNAAEVCLVHKDIADAFLPILAAELDGVELRLDDRASRIIKGKIAAKADFDTEFLDYILAVGIVDSVDAAISHIALHSTGHSEAIITADKNAAIKFTATVDSAAVYVNASTRFTDGGEFGLGCEMGISTQKLHARGPIGLRELCSYKYVIEGNGQIR